jgi:hypothetical protein
LTTQQLSILNSLVTYAAENIPGGLDEDEQAVAQIVGNWSLGLLGKKEYDYLVINPTRDLDVRDFSSTEESINSWAERGWRVVGTAPSSLSGRTSPRILYGVILERPVRVSHPDD